MGKLAPECQTILDFIGARDAAWCISELGKMCKVPVRSLPPEYQHFFYYSPDVLPATKATMLMLFHNRYFSAGPRWMCKCFPDSLQHCMYGVLRLFIAYGKLQK